MMPFSGTNSSCPCPSLLPVFVPQQPAQYFFLYPMVLHHYSLCCYAPPSLVCAQNGQYCVHVESSWVLSCIISCFNKCPLSLHPVVTQKVYPLLLRSVPSNISVWTMCHLRFASCAPSTCMLCCGIRHFVLA